MGTRRKQVTNAPSKASRSHNTAKAMIKILQALSEDLKPFVKDETITSAVRTGSIVELRRLSDAWQPGLFRGDALCFKARCQLLLFLKRFTFANDVYSDDDRAAMTLDKFWAAQQAAALPISEETRALLYRSGFIKEVRRVMSSVLGQYDREEHERLCSFAKRACVGHPLREARLDLKLQGPITGSRAHLDWFTECVRSRDQLLNDVVKAAHLKATTSLSLTLVPKSYKALRVIMPNTLAGSFYTAGLGRVIENRLQKHGLDIRRLQKRHRRLAKAASTDGWKKSLQGSRNDPSARLATLDLSSASDSISIQLLSMILPREWFRIVRFGHIRRVTLDGRTFLLSSVCTMGLGHTFPLETLVFYALTRAIERCLYPNRTSLISVYGDDLIMPGYLAGPVKVLFPKLGFKVNDEKSFVGYCDFRESCGGDYYRGVAVRPANPQGSEQLLGSDAYVCFLYKVLNLLLRRWDECTIQGTITTILDMIFYVHGELHFVPKHFPDEGGAKLDPNRYFSVPETRNWGTPLIEFWAFVPRKLAVVKHESAYYWDTLRVNSEREANPHPWVRETQRNGVTVRYIEARDRSISNPLRLRCVKTRHGVKFLPFVPDGTGDLSVVLRTTLDVVGFRQKRT